MLVIELIDLKGDYWKLEWANAPERYLYKGEVYWKSWWHAITHPYELRGYEYVPLPIFTEWWPE